MGLFTIEQTLVLSNGEIFTRGPGTYKIPSFNDVPLVLNVRLLKDSINKKAVYSSKAVGEPPLFLSASVFFAIREAIKAARSEEGVKDLLVLNSPATVEQIRLACKDKFTRSVRVKETGRKWCLRLED